MSVFSMCPACGSDWCSGCECVKDKLKQAEAALAAMTEERNEHRKALVQILKAAYAVWGEPEDCDDCAELGDTPCRVHSPKPGGALIDAVLACEQVLGPCPCGHDRSQHHDLDSTKCRECHCPAFKAALAPREEPQA